MMTVRPLEFCWEKGEGYHTENPDQLRKKPLLPDLTSICDRRLSALFDDFGNLRCTSQILEIGCGRSRWLPYLSKKTGCAVFGIDIEPYAVEWAQANLEGAGAGGYILCRDAFSPKQNAELRAKFDLIFSMGVIAYFHDDVARRIRVLRSYLKPGGRIITTVPNLQGLNWILQRLADRERLQMRVAYDTSKLIQAHEAGGFTTLSAGYVGFYDGFLTAAAGLRGPLRPKLHRLICSCSARTSVLWTRVLPESMTLERRWLAPFIYYAGRAHPIGLVEG